MQYIIKHHAQVQPLFIRDKIDRNLIINLKISMLARNQLFKLRGLFFSMYLKTMIKYGTLCGLSS